MVGHKNATKDTLISDVDLQVPPIRVGKPQAVPVPGSKREGFSEIYRNVNSVDQLITTYHPTISTVAQAFETTVSEYPKKECWGEREYDPATQTWGKYVYQTYEEVGRRRANFGKGLADLVQDVTGLDSRAKPYCVALYGPNTAGWLLADIACQSQSLPTVCLYDTLGPESTEYIINLTEVPVVVASIPHISTLLKSKDRYPHLKVIVAITPMQELKFQDRPGHNNRDTLLAWAKSAGVTLKFMPEVEALGEKSARGLNLPSPQDTLTINFTSGTTGNPKGVVISHANVVAALVTSRQATKLMSGNSTGYISFLPLAHIYERINIQSMLAYHIRIGFFHGDVTGLLDDFAAYRPTIVAGVPRVWNRIAAALRAQTIEAPGIAGALSRKAYESKLARLHQTGINTHPIWDRLWSNKIRAKTGFDNAAIFITGSAPMASENIDFLKCALAVDFVQGYGLTETMGGISVCNPGDNKAGSVGPVNLCTEVCLRDLPDYNYLSSDKPNPRGEVMIRGPQVFMGYYKNEEATEKSITKDGWFHTGDVGMIDSEGRLYIIDRVKNFFKLAQGEYVGPERIESLYQSSSSLIGQIFVEGNSLETYLVAVIGVSPDTYAAFLNTHFKYNVQITDVGKMQESFSRDDVRHKFLKEVGKHASKVQLKGYEKIKNLVLKLEPFSVENGTMTPTLKVKRNEAAKLFKSDIDAMYAEGPIADQAKL